MANFMRRLSGRGEDVGLPINTECSMTSKFKDIEEAWFEKSKKDKIWSPWRKRWVVLDMKAKMINYYDDQSKAQSRSDPSGSMKLSEETNVVFVDNCNGKQHVFEISGVSEGKGEEILILSAESGTVRDYWHQAITECTKGILVKQPDLLPDSFFNVTPLSVFYKDSEGKNTIKAHDGAVLLPENTQKPPAVRFFPRSDGDYYTLMLTDPDAPCVSKPTFREYVHWMVVNIPAHGEVSHGRVICPYVGAGPPYNGGTHRYIFLLYLQDMGQLTPTQCHEAIDHFKQRGGLRCCDWAKDLSSVYGDDPTPVGFDGFKAVWSPFVDIMHESAGFIPPEAYRSPSQVARIKAEAEREKAEALRKKAEEESAVVKAEEAVAAVAIASNSPIDQKYGTGNESIFEGHIIHKKFAHELVYQKRFCWIDPEERKLFWAKTATKEKAKSVNLENDISAINLQRNKISFTHSMGKKSSIDLEICGTVNDNEEAERWYKLAIMIHYKQ